MFWTDLHHYGPSLRLIVPYGAAWVPISLKSVFLETPCIFKDGVIHYSPFLFVIRIPSLCVGASLDYIERNPCGLPAGEEVLIAAINFDHNNLRQGVCCVDISIDNIISIVDAPPVVVDIPNNLDTQGIFLRTDFGVTVRTSAIVTSKNRFTDLKTICQPSASSRCDCGHKFCGRQRAK